MVALPDPLNDFSVAVPFETAFHHLRIGFSIVAGGPGTPATSYPCSCQTFESTAASQMAEIRKTLRGNLPTMRNFRSFPKILWVAWGARRRGSIRPIRLLVERLETRNAGHICNMPRTQQHLLRKQDTHRRLHWASLIGMLEAEEFRIPSGFSTDVAAAGRFSTAYCQQAGVCCLQQCERSSGDRVSE